MEHALVLVLILVAMVLFALEVTRPDVVALGVTLALLLTGTVTVAEGFSGFSNPAVITVVAMFILSAGLVRTGVADWIAGFVARAGGSSPVRLTLIVMLAAGVMSAFMNNIAAVAVLMPAMFVIARKTGYPVAKLLMPLSFGSLLGGLTTVIGTPPNLLVSIALEESRWDAFEMFDFLPTGLAVLAVGATYMALVGRFLIPEREGDGGDLTETYALQDYLTELIVPEGSPFADKTLAESDIHSSLGLTVLRVQRAVDDDLTVLTPSPDMVLRVGDRLVVEGSITDLVGESSRPLDIYAETKLTDEDLTSEDTHLGEAAIAPGSRLVGTTIARGWIRRRYGVLVLALRRRGETLRDRFIAVPLEVGDVLLVQGPENALSDMAASRDFLMVNRIESKRRLPKKVPYALGSMAIAITLAATGLLHISVAGMIGVLLMVLTGCIRPEEMYRDIEWWVIFLIAFMMPLGIAMDDDHSGTARWLADNLVDLVGDFGPYVVLAGLIIFTTVLTEVMSNAAAAVLLSPIGIAIAVGMGFEPYPFLMGIAIGASTTFLTPIGHQSNLLIYGVGNYRFTDFPRVGGPLNVLLFGVAMLVVPWVWPFTPIP
ncbi:MAG TPA: SLC13 family permease [Acidimicrobiia bacterium]|nr:SLC13 family permease [Acidimicrobiia bacterium]